MGYLNMSLPQRRQLIEMRLFRLQGVVLFILICRGREKLLYLQRMSLDNLNNYEKREIFIYKELVKTVIVLLLVKAWR